MNKQTFWPPSALVGGSFPPLWQAPAFHSPANRWRANGRKVIVSDVDHVWPRKFPQWPWKRFMRGLNTAFMDLYGGTKIGDKEIKSLKFVGDWLVQHETSRRRMGHTRTLADRVNLVL